MKEILCREFTRRSPFAVEKLPWIAKMYRYPFDKWTAVGKQGLFGAPNYLLFFLYQKISPIKIEGAFSCVINGQKRIIRFNTKSTHFRAIYSKMFSMGYEPHASALIDFIVPDNGVFYDIGSNWGWFTLWLASRSGFAGRIHAFEPCPPTFQDVTSVVEQAGIGDRVKCHSLALMDKVGSGSIHLPDHIHRECAIVSEDAKGGMAIQTTTLDAMNLEAPDVIKMDVEGNELKAFGGSIETLRKHKPMLIFENHRNKTDVKHSMEPLQFLEKQGYTFYHVAWLRNVGGPCLIGDDCDPEPQPEETLALVPFVSAERFLFHDSMNILACHRDKISLLESRFEKKQI